MGKRYLGEERCGDRVFGRGKVWGGGYYFAMLRSNVLFPIPFLPTSPYLLP